MARFVVDGIEYKDVPSLRRAYAPVRKQVIDWSMALPGSWHDDYRQRVKHVVWESEDRQWAVGFYKFGNEYNRIPQTNPHDMKPTIWLNGEVLTVDPSFHHIYDFFESLLGIDVLEPRESMFGVIIKILMGDAFLLYHKPNELRYGRFEYTPPLREMRWITGIMPEFIDNDGIVVNTEAYLHYIDAIAQNEDVKFNFNTELRYFGDRGRINNLLTYVNYIYSLWRIRNAIETGIEGVRNTFRANTRMNPNPYQLSKDKSTYVFSTTTE